MDDRTIALVSATTLEQALESAILQKLVPLDPEEERQLFSEDGAPLSNFHAKIRLAYALGIVGPRARDDLMLIKHIRNAFAHKRLKIDFETEAVAAVCGLITYPERVEVLIDIPPPNGRERFIQAARGYATPLIAGKFAGKGVDEFTALVLDLSPPDEANIESAPKE